MSKSNKLVLLNVILICCIYLIIDVFLLNYQTDVDAISKSFYSKVVLSFIYFMGSKGDGFDDVKNNEYLKLIFYFSLSLLCLWLPLINITLSSMAVSKYMSLVVLIGGGAGFLIFSSVLKKLYKNHYEKAEYIYRIEISMKIYLLFIILFSLSFLVLGEWLWDIKPFYEWEVFVN